jgi:predicted P-loop ATPase
MNATMRRTLLAPTAVSAEVAPVLDDADSELALDLYRNPIPNEANVVHVLGTDPALKDCLRFNEFTQVTEVVVELPGYADGQSIQAAPKVPTMARELTDADIKALTVYIQKRHIPRVGREKVANALDVFARKKSCNPLQDYLSNVEWDGTPRIDKWLQSYMGAAEGGQPDSYLRAVGAKFLVSAIARAFSPGCKVDHALVLEGAQGIGKSTALRVLAGEEYFSDSLPSDLGDKDSRAHLKGKWLIELPELTQFRKAEIETIKAYISRQKDQYRPAYGRQEVAIPRTCVFAGTTNDETYLVDHTGNRRWWTVRCGNRIDLDGLRRDRDQLWAEAVHRYRAGGAYCWHLSPQEEALQSQEAKQRVAVDTWTPDVQAALERLSDDNLGIATEGLSPTELLKAMGWYDANRSNVDAPRMGRVMQDLGWVRRPKRHRTRGQVYLPP